MLHEHAEYQVYDNGLHILNPEDQLGHEDADPSQDWCACARTIKDQKEEEVQNYFEELTTALLNNEKEPFPSFSFLTHRSELLKATDEGYDFMKKKTRTWKPFPCSDKIARLTMYMVGEFVFAKNPEGFQAMLDRNIAGPLKISPKQQHYLWEGYWKNNPCKGGRVSLVKRADGGV